MESKYNQVPNIPTKLYSVLTVTDDLACVITTNL